MFKSIIYKSLIPFSKVESLIQRENLKVLAYHTVPDSLAFERQLTYLKKHYNIVGVLDLVNNMDSLHRLPQNSLLITFDDGDYSVYEKGLPLLVKYDIPSVLFVITDLIGTREDFWWKQIERYFKSKGDTYKNARSKINELKKSTNKARESYLRSLPKFDYLQLNSEQLRECQSKGMYVGNHTASHPMIDQCTEEEVREELSKAKMAFEEIGLPGYSIFAYPNGNWDAVSEKILDQKDIKLAFLFDHKINRSSKNFNPMRISRIRVSTNTSIDEFKVKVSGLHSRLMYLKNKIKA
ncbi:polysaccharide deacetylase family protein [uncultured Christiangramia sp.]|uniref:polysaccharide deacetylase family protein n=1 Tax=uncultured Christiangramia sp. TaxID=503836 RepID=UPI002606EED2|nr:polysaccharide deacetylase family protein [uncultured Christiangramia sp.]